MRPGYSYYSIRSLYKVTHMSSNDSSCESLTQPLTQPLTQSLTTIDWDSVEAHIKSYNTMTDDEINQVLSSLSRAKTVFKNAKEYPERIALTDKMGYTRHTIITPTGRPTTVIIKPLSADGVCPLSNKHLLILSSASIVILSLFWYLYF